VLYNALNTMKAKKLSAGKFSDGQGLWLIKRNRQHGKWILRLAIAGRRREMGMGRWPDVTIAEARARAAEYRKQLRDGVDPIAERTKLKYQMERLTISEAIHGCFEARKAELKDDGKAGGWMSPLSVHIIPKIGDQPIESLNQHILKDVFSPIWHKKADVARKAMFRINLTLKHAAALGLNVDLLATMKAKALLGKQRHTVKHIPSLPYQEAPAFYKMLCKEESASCLALRFLMLTLARTSEVRLATFKEIDSKVWTLPPERTKAGREHRIPLVTESLKLIELAKISHGQEFLFPSPYGKAMSDATMSKFMKERDYKARPHGFRATFRTWVEEKTNTEYEVKEAVLGHVVDSGVVRAYQRSDRFKKRKALLQQWSKYLTSKK